MNIADLKNILHTVLDGTKTTQSFDALFEQYKNADDKERYATQVWQYMADNHYIPDHLSNEDELGLVEMLRAVAQTTNQGPEPLRYALILLHRHYLLCDILEKGFAAEQVAVILYLQLLAPYGEGAGVRLLLNEVIDRAIPDPLFWDAFDEEDKDVNGLTRELLRAVIPMLRWLCREFPQAMQCTPQQFAEIEQLCETDNNNRKPAIPKFTAIAEYLYATLS